jgi:hypothetical protein
MANNSGRVKKIDLGNATWISLLSQCIDSIGSDQFTDKLLSALRSITDFDYSVSFAYHQNEKPICLFHTFSHLANGWYLSMTI